MTTGAWGDRGAFVGRGSGGKKKTAKGNTSFHLRRVLGTNSGGVGFFMMALGEKYGRKGAPF